MDLEFMKEAPNRNFFYSLGDIVEPIARFKLTFPPGIIPRLQSRIRDKDGAYSMTETGK
jgi:hypothetical protein